MNVIMNNRKGFTYFLRQCTRCMSFFRSNTKYTKICDKCVKFSSISRIKKIMEHYNEKRKKGSPA